MARKLKSKFSEEELITIQEQVEAESLPYDYKTKDYPFEVLISKFGEEYDNEATLYVPSYQRQYVWKTDRASRFIESVLLGVPLTPFLVSEDENGRLEIIDGSQRIRTLIAFKDDNLRLRKLKKLSSINTAKFKDLPRKLQFVIKNRDFKVIVVSGKANLAVRQDVFDRINTSSEPLKDSEIRKGVFSGDFYDLILQLKLDEGLHEVCPVPITKESRGEYEELILRFFTYADLYQDFRHDVAAFLNLYLDGMNSSGFDKEEYETAFLNMIQFVKTYFPFGFRKEEKSGSTPRVRFEAIAVGTHLALKIQPDLEPEYFEWLNSKEFAEHTTSDSSNNRGKLAGRIEFVRDCLLNKTKMDSLTYA